MVAGALGVQHEANAEVDVSDLTPWGVVLRGDESTDNRVPTVIDFTISKEIDLFRNH